MVIPRIRGMSLGQFGKILLSKLRDHTITDRAAQLSYYFLFALFPFLFFLVTLTAYLPLEGAIDILRLNKTQAANARAVFKDGQDVVLAAPDPVSVGRALARVLDDKVLQEKLRIGGRAFVKQLGWEKAGRVVEQSMRELRD